MNNGQQEVADIGALEKRASDLQDWLKENAPEVFAEQKHLDEDSQERVYWHYGYLVAVRDIYRLLTGQRIPSQAHRSQEQDKDASFPSA
jgi:hypothetical protein